MAGYYSDKLTAERLEQCYQIAPPRIVQYLEAELTFALSRTHAGDELLDMGCGYGRLMPRLAEKAGMVVGIDTAIASLRMARRRLSSIENCYLFCMDASRTAFADSTFDIVLCLQNGISAFSADRKTLIAEAVRLLRRGGRALFSSYSPQIWSERLDWFRRQAEAGLLGEIDERRTGDGVIVCRDGFRATTVGAEQFEDMVGSLGLRAEISEVDQSSIFCEVCK